MEPLRLMHRQPERSHRRVTYDDLLLLCIEGDTKEEFRRLFEN